MEKLRQNMAQGLPASFYVLVTALLVVIVGVGSVYLFTGGNSPDEGGMSTEPLVMAVSGEALPDYAMASDGVKAAYRFAADRPDVMRWMVCYCGCGDHSGHKSALNCFVKEGGREWDQHGSECDICVGIALDAMTMTDQGRSLKDIRAYIDGKYGAVGPGTDTPRPPA